ncbi:hypothetical protein [Thauera humireducens]|uniref:hypothetical protein n=1 Tax=Thauera humireducens TaxID=1134435 RepID=UPI0024A89339|nr:hypothetical protein [Thauera humireducens]
MLITPLLASRSSQFLYLWIVLEHAESPRKRRNERNCLVCVERLIVDLRAIKRFCIVQLGCPAGRSS